eukprot:gnl/TRDRNA2_/TRDRNA2_172262_c4_seq15.p2 gnl/TRDRNA2_/TRDRNA2_172262_c4~~gnl/TRDRNA2_/TRDRNA2_172262_c4_seq15.p2  ORF type:complete len:217 (+),score=18.69 gnl/TRDRNA2_/TRDRNA2_172262_c4_seq15:68-652(+)
MTAVERQVVFEGIGHAFGDACKYKDQREIFTDVGVVATFHFVGSWCCLEDETFLPNLASSLHKDPHVVFYGGSTYWDITRQGGPHCWQPGETWRSFAERSAATAMTNIADFANSLSDPPRVIVRSGPTNFAGTFRIYQEQELIERPAMHKAMPDAWWWDYLPLMIQARQFGFDHPSNWAQRSVTMTLLNMVCRT